jgi:phosphate transport system substrate-binding protein
MSVPVVRLPSAIFVHPSVRVRNVTAAQLVDLFEGRITNWRDLGGDDQRVRVIRREDGDSTLGVLRTSLPGWQDLQFTEKSKLAKTTQEMLEDVQGFEGAIAFGPYTRALEAHIGVMRIGGFHPTDAAYPSYVTLRLAFRVSDVTPQAIGFIRYARSEKAQRLFTTLGGLPVVLPDLSPSQ